MRVAECIRRYGMVIAYVWNTKEINLAAVIPHCIVERRCILLYTNLQSPVLQIRPNLAMTSNSLAK